MKILFTKKIEKSAVSKILGTNFSYDFVEVIRGQHIDKAPFDLEANSLIFTSVRGVKSFFKNGFCPNQNSKYRIYNKIYTVGKKTKEELTRNGFETYQIARNADELSDFILKHCRNESFVHFCGDLALDIFSEKLPVKNIPYRKEVVYRTELLYPIVQNPYDALVFFSPSGVRSFMRNNTLKQKTLFAIGQTTAKEIEKYTFQPIYISKENHLEDLLMIIRDTLQNCLFEL